MLTPSMKETVARLNKTPGSEEIAATMEDFFGEPLNTHGDRQAEFLAAEAKLLSVYGMELLAIMTAAPTIYEAITTMRGIAISYAKESRDVDSGDK